MKREVEDALVSLYISKDLDPEAGRQKGLSFIDLLPYLATINKRWSNVKPDTIDYRDHACMKALYYHFNLFRLQPKKLAPLIESRKQEASDSEANDIHGDYGEEENDTENCIKDEQLPSHDEAPAAKAVVHAMSQPADQTISKESQCSGSRLGVRERGDAFTQDEVDLWMKIGKITKRAKLAQMEIVASF